MFNTADELKSAIVENEPRDFVSHHIFEPIPFAFEGNLPLWIHWKSELAQRIDVDPYNIILTGSAAIGFSLNPNKNFSRYHDKSDFDCGVISPHHFDLSWRFLRQKRPAWMTLDNATKQAIEWHRKNLVFSGTIATDQMLGILPFGKIWVRALDEVRDLSPASGRDVKVRIYKDFEALRDYHANNVDNLRAEILGQEPTLSEIEQPIGTEDG